MNPRELRDAITERARELGFDRIGCVRAGACRDRERLEDWLDRGDHGEMAWMERRVGRRSDPREVLPEARTVISLLTFYATDPEGDAAEWIGRVSRYAWGSDYHSVLERRMKKLVRAIGELEPGSTTLTAVDHRPVLEKEWAERAGLGWIGKHTNLITPDAGSWFFLSELVTTVELPTDERTHPDRCGRCTECIDACPTGAITAPWTVDARRCISYLTIELKGPIPRELRPLVGEWMFGCDVCQDVCPWNRFATPVEEPRFRVDEGRFHGDPADFLSLSEEAFRARFRGSPVRRAGRDGFLRNVCVALGNRGDAASVPALAAALDDESPLVRAHAAWALGRIGGEPAHHALTVRAATERNADVRGEIDLAREGRDAVAPSDSRPERSTGAEASPGPGA